MSNGQIVSLNGQKIMLNRTFKSSPDYLQPSTFQIGVGTTTPIVSDTALAHKIPISGTEDVDTCEATTGWTDSADMTVSLNTSIYKIGSGALNLTKDATATTTASTSKTTTSLNFTSKDLSIWIYVADSTVLAQLATSNCFTLRFGSDSSNYYQWTKNASFFAVGWNLIDGFTSGTGAVTGSPSITACDYTYVGITATSSGQTWTAGKIVMDDIKLASTADYINTFVSGYPTLDETNLFVTFRGVIDATQANGYSLTEFGIFNADSTPLMFSRTVHTAISKTTSVAITYVEKDQL